MRHEPIVLERNDWRITKAACSCGAELQLPGNVGSVRDQSQKLVVAFQKHKIEKETARQNPAHEDSRGDNGNHAASHRH